MHLKTFLMTTAGLALSATTALADYSLAILHTNDFHARFEPISKYDGPCSAEDNAEGKCFGGSARLVTAVEAAKRQYNNVILVDGGDQFQGTLFYTYYKGKMAAEFMNKLGYDAMTVGNHEFDDGPEDELASPGKNITFSVPANAVAVEVGRLEAQGVNKIIVLSHSGYDVDLAVAEAVPGIDVIVGGHSNTLLSNSNSRASGPYPTMVGNVAVVQAYAYGKYLGELNVNFDDEGNLTSAAGEPILIDGNVTEDAASVARIAELAAPLEEIRSKVVANTGAAIGGRVTGGGRCWPLRASRRADLRL